MTAPPVLRYGHPGFFDAYGAAWGFKEALVAFYAPDGEYTDKASNVTIKGPEMLHRFMKVYLRSIDDLEPILDLFTPHGRTTTSIVHSAPVPPRPLPVPLTLPLREG